MITVRTYKTYGVFQAEWAEYLTSIILLRSAIIYGRQHTPTKTADTNIDGNDVHVTNTDENTFDDTI